DGADGNYSPTRQVNTSLGYTWVATHAIVNDSRFGYLRSFRETQVPSLGQNWAQQLGIPNVDGSLMPGFGMFNITGANPSKSINETLSYRNDTTYVRGSHALKFGYGLIHVRLNQATIARSAQFNFDNITSGVAANGSFLANTGIAFAGFLT